jgi:hypothetical protein
MTETEVDCTGFDRVCYIIMTGAAGATGSKLNFKVTEAAATGMANAADITGAALVEVTGAAPNLVYAIDCHVNAAKPFQIAVGTVGTNTFANGAVAVLYEGSGQFPKTAATEAVIV